MKIYTNYSKAKQENLPIYEILPERYITLENAKELGIHLSRKKDGYIKVGINKYTPIWDMKENPKLSKPIFMYMDQIKGKNLFTKEQAKDIFHPIKKDREPDGYLMYSNKNHYNFLGATYHYIPLYTIKKVHTQSLVRKYINQIEVTKMNVKYRDIEVRVKEKTNKNRVPLSFTKENNYYKLDGFYWMLGYKPAELAYLLAIVTKLYQSKESLRMLFSGIREDNTLVPFQEYSHPESNLKTMNYITIEQYLKMPLYE